MNSFSLATPEEERLARRREEEDVVWHPLKLVPETCPGAGEVELIEHYQASALEADAEVMMKLVYHHQGTEEDPHS